MSVYSMTGFAAAQQATETHENSASVGMEVRTVNSRFLDIQCRIPDAFRTHETALRKLIGDHIKRGKVEVRIFTIQSHADFAAVPSAQMLAQLASAQNQIKAWLPHARDLSVAEVLRLDGAGQGGGEGQVACTWEVLQKLATQVLKALVVARKKEGARLVALLQSNVAQLRELAQKAQPLVPQMVEQQRERFIQRWNEALEVSEAKTSAKLSGDTIQERALTEATAFAIRIDVAEELGRLAAHLDEITGLLEAGGELGKRLDFMMQELHREANTLGSKSATLELSRISMDMKVLIEQMREQVQNIE